MDFLMQACSRPWSRVEIGGIDKREGGVKALSANHVYVNGEIPFLMAATSIESPSGEEFFGVSVIKDLDVAQRFLEGPYPPHNRPRTLSLEQIARADVAAFMREGKQVRVFRHTAKFATDVVSLVPIEVGLAIEASGFLLKVFAYEEIPMGLKIAWEDEVEIDPAP